MHRVIRGLGLAIVATSIAALILIDSWPVRVATLAMLLIGVALIHD